MSTKVFLVEFLWKADIVCGMVFGAMHLTCKFPGLTNRLGLSNA